MRKVKQIAAIFFKHLVRGVKISAGTYKEWGEDIALKIVRAAWELIEIVIFTPVLLLLPLITAVIYTIEEVEDINEN